MSRSGAPRGPHATIQRLALELWQPPAQPPAGAAESEVGDGREASLVGAQRQQQVRDPVAGWQPSVGDLAAVAIRETAARPNQDRARFPDQPDAESTALEHETGPVKARFALAEGG